MGGEGGDITHPTVGRLSSVTSQGHLEIRVGTSVVLNTVDFAPELHVTTR
jgi:hypothetical protein